MSDTTTPTPEEVAARNAAMEADVRAGLSLRATGKKYGMSHEGVRLVVGPDAVLEGMTKRGNAQLAAQRQRNAPRTRYTKTCVAPVLGRDGKPRTGPDGNELRHGVEFVTTDPRRVTCSPECAAVWSSGARHRGPEAMPRHQVHVARTYLRRPWKYDAGQKAWARRLLDREGLPYPAELPAPDDSMRKAS